MLIREDEDDAAMLAAEDEAIRALEAGERIPDGTFELPDSLAHLVIHDDGSVPEGAQG